LHVYRYSFCLNNPIAFSLQTFFFQYWLSIDFQSRINSKNHPRKFLFIILNELNKNVRLLYFAPQIHHLRKYPVAPWWTTSTGYETNVIFSFASQPWQRYRVFLQIMVNTLHNILWSLQSGQYLPTSASAVDTPTFPHPLPITRATDVGKSCSL
jgi:hypothetical protein